MSVLDIASGFSLPLDAATETFGILAKRGAGKSNAAVVMAEEMFDAQIPWVAIDPKGDWWGLRASKDGKKPGLPIPVFGGRHGDIPLEPSAGAMMAELILGQMLTCVLDVSEFTKAETIKFLTPFAERLLRLAEDEPFHLFLEEAHEYLPQRVGRDETRLVGAWQKIIKQGRFKGIGCTLISQRSASVNKDVLTQVETLIVLRTTSPQDRAAVKGWVDVHTGATEMLETLPSLKTGEAWVWSPVFDTFERIRFRQRRTYDSGATPKVGEKRRAPATLADVDLEAIRSQMVETIERVKENDPKELKKRIRDLEARLARQKPQVEVVEKVVEVEVEVVPQEFQKILDAADTSLQGALASLQKLSDLASDGSTRRPEVRSPRVFEQPKVERPKAEQPRVTTETGTTITGGARRMLEVLAWYPKELTRTMLATLAGLKASSGTYSNYLSILKTSGMIEVSGSKVAPTRAGLDYIGEVAPMSELDLQEQWRRKLTGGAQRMFDILLREYPGGLSRQELADAAELAASSGTYSNYLSILRTNNLIEEYDGMVTASRTLFFD